MLQIPLSGVLHVQVSLFPRTNPLDFLEQPFNFLEQPLNVPASTFWGVARASSVIS